MALAALADADDRQTSPFSNYMVYRDGRPFLIVNATFANVRRLVERFALYEAEFSWMFRPQ